jgi:transglutaminase/protease-like cytokinesis protein 3
MGNTAKKKTKPTSRRQVKQKSETTKGDNTSEAVPHGAKPGSQTTPGTNLTKTDQVLSLLKQPSGVTLKQIMEITGWQAHSVRGFISGHVAKKMGLRVKSFRRDGERAYAIKG